MHKKKQATYKRGYKGKHWCFTLNNPKEGEVVYLPHQMTYLIAGLERAPQTGTEHVQGYVVFKARKQLPGVKKIYPRAHIEACVGTPQQNIKYCKKEGNFREFGKIPRTQQVIQKQKWDLAKHLAMTGRINEIESGMMIRYYHSFKRIYQDNPKPVQDLNDKDNYWIVAPSGFGKSTYARERWPNFYDKPPNKWWTGYKDQPTILCDDFGPQQCEYIGWYMKRWADIFTFPIETKGSGCAAIRPRRIIVTSQYDIHDCWEDALVVDAIQNRFQVIRLTSWQEREADKALLRAREQLDDNEALIVIADEHLSDIEEEFNDRTATTVEYDSEEAQHSEDEIDLTQLYGYTAQED